MRRPVLLACAVLFGAGAADYGPDPADGVSHFVGTGAYGGYLTGRFAAQQSDLGVAADRLEAVLTLEPGVPELAEQAFLAALLDARPDAARLASSLPNDPIARLDVADREAKSGNWDTARMAFDNLPQQGLTQVLRPLLVAWAELGAGRSAIALASMQAAIDAGRFRPVMTLHAGLIADLGGRAGEAGRLYEAARREYGVMNIRLGQILASWYARRGDMAQAESTVAEMAAANPDVSLARQALLADAAKPAVRNAADGLAEVYLAMAATLRQQNAPDLALVVLRLALDVRPDFTAARLLLSDMQDTAKQTAGALDTLQAVPPGDPLATVVQLRRAGLLDELDQTDAAASLLNELAAQHPNQPEPLAALGDLLRRHNRFAEAVAVYDRAIARLGTPTRGNWPLFYARGIALERDGKWDRAEADFRYALELSPDQPGVLNYLGYAWAERGEHLDQAHALIERALEQDPNDGSIIDSLGWVLLLQGDKAGALARLQRAVELMPEDSTVNGHLGDALQAVGRNREAEFEWRRALTFQPEPAEAARIEAKLRTLPGVGGPGVGGPGVGGPDAGGGGPASPPQ